MIDLEIGEFKPCVIEYSELRMTEMVIRDCVIVWRQYGLPGHYIDLGYDEQGTLVGIKIWDNVEKA